MEKNADQLRMPASLTKIMTLFLTFDALKEGRIKLTDPIRMSWYAVTRRPTKLYLKPGRCISVEDAIKATAVKSANDAATALAEHLAGNEKKFAKLMNQKAKEIGLHQTHFRNASGLPNSRQLSTARDIAKLAKAVLDQHPEYAYFFSLPHFSFNRRRYKNTNTILGKVAGVDGMKTGYTFVAGHCMVVTQSVDDARVIGVVMGEETPKRRDVVMTYLLKNQIPTLAQIQQAERRITSKRRLRRVSLYWAVQTGAFQSRKQAIKFNAQLRKDANLKDVLSNKSLFTRLVAPFKKRKHYTTRVGRFKTKDEAYSLCQSMKEKSLSCLVVKSR
ncbi:MAG: D-alanyl-D-alanine carboxypeptidase [Holosporaceae bacterium]|nr:MAG: D-alanyl-D-alanine carboxypeptidase [Holosporaceae bacterium]